MSISEKPGHSATVDLQLHVGGRVLPLSQVGPDHCILAVPTDIAAGCAEIVVVIDGRVQRRAVELLPKILGSDRRIPVKTI